MCIRDSHDSRRAATRLPDLSPGRYAPTRTPEVTPAARARTGHAVRTQGGIVRRLGRLTILTLTLAGLSLLLGACSASVGTTDESSPGPKTYTNDRYGFTLTYDGQLEEGESTGGVSSGGSSVFGVAFADKSGPRVGGNYANGMQISVYKLAREIKPAEVPKLKKEVSGVVKQIMAPFPAPRSTSRSRNSRSTAFPGSASVTATCGTTSRSRQ